MNLSKPDLTQHSPRSPRVRLGGYVILPRMLDKGRATIAGKNGEYHYACPTDQQFLQYVGIDADALKQELAAGRSDSEMLDWIKVHAQHKHTPAEIETWNAWQERRAPDNPDSRSYFNELHTQIAPQRTDLVAWFDLLDADDFASYGGKV